MPNDWGGTPIRRGERGLVDTNVVVYSFDGRFPEKQAVARKLLSESGKILSCQVLTETASVLIARFGMSAGDVAEVVRSLGRYEIVPTTPILVERALAIVAISPRKIWDGLMVAAAIEANCKVLYSEDMGHNETIAGIQIVNPFL